MLILGLNKTTLLDYPEHVAATVFTGGCNFRCPYCHNRELVLKSSSLISSSISETALFSFLEKRRGILTGVCITGGEPTLQPDLPEFIRQIKALGYLVKLDTNGTNPDMLKFLIHAGLIDYCALDVKNSPDKYNVTVGVVSNNLKFDLSTVKESIQFLIHQSTISYEFRTTIVQELHSEVDMRAICQWIIGAQTYFLQSYTDSEGVLCKGFHAHSKETLQTFVTLCREYIPNTTLRGI